MDRVLAFGCHPDDVEFMCAGTLALLADKGCEVHIAVMAGGEMGSTQLPPQQIRQKRLDEAIAAAGVIGAKFHYAGGYDIEVEYNGDYRRRAVRVMREVDPRIVFTAPPSDYLVDHEETSRLVRNAAFIATVPNYDCGVPTRPTSKTPYLYYWNAVELKDIFGRSLPLTCAVDISTTLARKTQMLACHASQRDWLRYVSGCDEYIDFMKRSAAQEGARAGMEAAEGFIQHLGHGHPRENILKTILGPACVEVANGT